MGISNSFKRVLSLVLVLTLTSVLFINSSAYAEEELQPVGNISIDEKQINIGIGASWGKGILSYQGKDHEFKVKGFKVGAVGVAKVSAVGEVYNMDDLSKFSGTYVASSAAIALGGGVGGQRLENQNKVYIKLRSTQKGVNVNIGIDGITLQLKDTTEKSD